MNCRSDVKKEVVRNGDDEQMKYFLIFSEMMNVIDKLDDDQAGRLLKALMHHSNGDDIGISGMEQLVYMMMVKSIDSNQAKYAETCEKRRAAINARWAKSNTSEQNSISSDTNVQNSIQMNTNEQSCIQMNYNTNTKTNTKTNTNTNIQSKRKRTVFTPPTVEEVQAYILEKGYSFNAEEFVAYYQAVEWMRKGQKVKNWHSLCVTWHRNESKYDKPQQQKPKTVNAQKYEQRTNDLDGAFTQFTPQELAEIAAYE